MPFMFVYEPALLMIGDWPADRRGLHHGLGWGAASWRRAPWLPSAVGALVGTAPSDRRGVLPDQARWISDLIGLALLGVVIVSHRLLPATKAGEVR